MNAIQNQMSETQYFKYLSKVNILNQKKDFLAKFRAQLPKRKKVELVNEIRQISAIVSQ